MWTKTSDGTVLDRDGKVVFFSAERFVNDICLGACCFICGVAPGIVDFPRMRDAADTHHGASPRGPRCAGSLCPVMMMR